jgi:hypothetical protein
MTTMDTLIVFGPLLALSVAMVVVFGIYHYANH